MHNKLLKQLLETLLDKYVSSNISEAKYLKRFNHSIAVKNKALEIVINNGYDINSDMYKDALIASILHDFCKFESRQTYLEVIEKHNLDASLINLPSGILHALLGCYIIKDTFGDLINDNIFKAIKYHSTGRSNMTFLEKVIYVSDYAEETRVGASFEEVRKALEVSLDKAVFLESKVSIDFIKSKGGEIDPLTIECYNYYKGE